MEPKISIITLGVANYENAVRFYREGLKFPVEGESPGITFFRLEGIRLAIFPKDKLALDANVSAVGNGFQGFTLAHNVLVKDEVDEILKLAEEAGARIVKPGKDASWGGYSGYFADPEGFLWEVAWNPFIGIPK